MLVSRNAMAIGALLVGLVSGLQGQTGTSGTQEQTGASKPTPSQTTSSNSTQDLAEGQRVLQQNCTRCHNAPEGLSPRVTGTIIRHMRVRAQLSKHDEQELLRFLAP